MQSDYSLNGNRHYGQAVVDNNGSLGDDVNPMNSSRFKSNDSAELSGHSLQPMGSHSSTDAENKPLQHLQGSHHVNGPSGGGDPNGVPNFQYQYMMNSAQSGGQFGMIYDT
jgi:hypothetical protein